MPLMAACPNPECGADLIIPRRLGAHVTCDECDMEWIVEDYDPVELVSVDEEEDWRAGLDDEEEEADDPMEIPLSSLTAGGLTRVTAARSGVAASVPQWECSECGMLQVGSRPPLKCPGCGASGDRFSMLADDLDEPLEDDIEDVDE